MAASLALLINSLKRLVVWDVNFMSSTSDFQPLVWELVSLLSMVEEASRQCHKDEIYKRLERNIRELVYDIEDMIDVYVTDMRASKHFLAFLSPNNRPAALAKAIQIIRMTRVRPLLIDPNFRTFGLVDAPEYTTAVESRETRQKKAQTIVGFETEAEEIINFLTAESVKSESISIVGMAGIGKTTMAKKIFEDNRIRYEFPYRIWLYISDDLNLKTVLFNLLNQFSANLPDMPIEDQIRLVRDSTKTNRMFIVMDDIWTRSAWDKIKEILPMDNENCRVLVTTRNIDVAKYCSTKSPHNMRYLTTLESWHLLQYEVFGDLRVVPQILEGVGHVIAEECNGLPLSIAVIGGILAEKKSRARSNISATKKEWEKVSKGVKSYLVDGDEKKILLSSISLSYENLPYDMKLCFLYLGMFPEGADIHVNEILRLWIAEEFIPEREGWSMEQVALHYLKELICLNLVMVKEARFDGKPKTCHIHNLVREVCKREAQYENMNLFEEITRSRGGFEPRRNMEKFRRLCIHSYALDFLKKTKNTQNARSFLCFHQTPMILESADMARITIGFGLLRVYNAKNIKFPKFPHKLLQFLHLRYLTLVVEECSSLPKVISRLVNLQTLIVVVSSRTLEIKADLWMMSHLRHLKTKASIILKKNGKGEGCDNLQTISRLSPESCTDNVFNKARNLTVLGVQGKLNNLVGFECFKKLNHLQKLKLENKIPNGLVAQYPPFQRLSDLPTSLPNLKILVLSSTNMNWTDISILSTLKCLQVLKLKNNAFTGNCWEARSIFDRLEFLHMEMLPELVYWKAYGIPFPNLRFLSLINCEKLVEFPLAICENIEKMYMDGVTKELVTSAEAIKENKHIQGVSFNLDIAPGAKSQVEV